MKRSISFADFERLRRKHQRGRWIIDGLIAVSLGLLVSDLCQLLYTDNSWLSQLMGVSAFACFWLMQWIAMSKLKPLTEKEWLVALDMQSGGIALSPFEESSMQDSFWQDRLASNLARLREIYRRQKWARLSALAPLVMIMGLIATFADGSAGHPWAKIYQIFGRLVSSVSLEVLSGNTVEGNAKPQSLSFTRLARFKVSENNLMELKVPRSYLAARQSLTVELRTEIAGKESLYQDFQLSEASSSNANTQDYILRFTVPASAKLYLPQLSRMALADIEVVTLPVPVVQLTTRENLTEPRPDDQPIELQIVAEGQQPLKQVRMVILVGKKRSEELVTNVLANDLMRINTKFVLNLSPYIETDVAEAEVFAEVVDSSVPEPLIGRSSSLIVKTLSAYGRYRQTLQTLNELKGILDAALSDREFKNSTRALGLISSAMQQAAISSYFDNADRHEIKVFKSELEGIIVSQNLENVGLLTERLNDFLFEHEMIDDRERDRDFFIAVRSFSRLLEKLDKDNPTAVSEAGHRIVKFLADRHKRWTLRVSHLLPQFVPPQWASSVIKNPFARSIEEVVSLSKTGNPSERNRTMSILTKTSGQYRRWIEELERAEQRSQEQREQKRQEGLASAADALREMQKRQDEISEGLDRAATRANEIAANWPTIRSKQNSNVTQSKQLEGQLRSLSPDAAQRIKVAHDAMQLSTEAGNQQKFVEAESASDLAGRMLRHAEKAAQRSQQKSPPRSRRQVPSDSSYGQTVVGHMELQRGYEVDKRYRSLLLEEVQRSRLDSDGQADGQDQKFLDEYLRHIVR